jgi:hypothetical protein
MQDPEADCARDCTAAGADKVWEISGLIRDVSVDRICGTRYRVLLTVAV